MKEWLLAGMVVYCLFKIGWIAAHREVAVECERQGSFYVGETVYNCSVKEALNGKN